MKECNDYITLCANKESSLMRVQKEFSEHYPFLKIELFKIYYKAEQLPKALVLTIAESAKKLDSTYDGRIINISKERKVAELEKDFEILFGLSALVFRKSGNVWVETTLTDDWTLEEQNMEGEQISLHF